MGKERTGGSCGEGDGRSKEGGRGNGGSKEGGVVQSGNVESGGNNRGSRQGRVESVVGIDAGSVKVIVDEDVSCCGGVKKGGTVQGGEIDGGTRKSRGGNGGTGQGGVESVVGI